MCISIAPYEGDGADLFLNIISTEDSTLVVKLSKYPSPPHELTAIFLEAQSTDGLILFKLNFIIILPKNFV